MTNSIFDARAIKANRILKVNWNWDYFLQKTLHLSENSQTFINSDLDYFHSSTNLYHTPSRHLKNTSTKVFLKFCWVYYLVHLNPTYDSSPCFPHQAALFKAFQNFYNFLESLFYTSSKAGQTLISLTQQSVYLLQSTFPYKH